MGRDKGKGRQAKLSDEEESSSYDNGRSESEPVKARSTVTDAEKKGKAKAAAKPRKSATSEPSDNGAPRSSTKNSREKNAKAFKSKEFIEDSDAELDGGDIPTGEEAREIKAAVESVSTRKPQERAIPSEKAKIDPQAGPSNVSSVKKRKPETSKPSISNEKTKKPKAEPPKRKRQAKEPETLSPDEETMKKYKALIVACGVRKVWSKELAGMDSPSEQIAHLRKMLNELGMKGRFSLEQAKTIKAKREIAQELEDVKSFHDKHAHADVKSRPRRASGEKRNKPHDDSEEEEPEVSAERPRKKNATQSIMAFLGDQSEEE